MSKRKLNDEVLQTGPNAAKRQRLSDNDNRNNNNNNNNNNDNNNNNNNNNNNTLENNYNKSYSIEWFGASDKGKKSHMEDRRIAINLSLKYKDIEYFRNNECWLFAILDGHGSDNISCFLQNNLPLIFMNNFKEYYLKYNNDQNIKIEYNNNNNNNNEKSLHNLRIQQTLHATFKICDKKILERMNSLQREGSTCTLCFILNNKEIWTSNVGDSKAVLARMNQDKRPKLVPFQLTIDHNVLQLSEVKRVESSTGYITNGRVNGILEVTRSFGDPEFKKAGVISVPNVSKFKICDRDQFMIIACDGLWSVFSVHDAVQFVQEKFNHKSKPNVQEVVRQLLAEAILNKQAKDNVSAIIIKFTHEH